MKIIKEYPPIIGDIKQLLDISRSDIIFTYCGKEGDTIYNPSGIEIPDHVMIHERVHCEQQRHSEEGAKEWWEKWLKDPEFRISQEVEAYGKQYKYICTIVRDKNARERNLNTMAEMLTWPMYGSLIDLTEAKRRIRKESLN